MTDLKERIRVWLDDETAAVEPVTVAELEGRSSRPRRAPRLAAAVILILVAAGSVVVASRTRHDGPRPSSEVGHRPNTPGPRYRDPVLRWTLEVPQGWHAQSYGPLCKIDQVGTVVTNLPGKMEHVTGPNMCTNKWEPKLLDRPGFVWVEISHYAGGPAGAGNTNEPNTPAPLDPANLREVGKINGPQRSGTVVIDGDARYFVNIWYGPDADPADVRTAERIVSSIDWSDHLPGPTTPPSWPDSDAVHRMPSQSEADARRDGVPAELAALPLVERGMPYLDDQRAEGTWWIARPPVTAQQGGDGRWAEYSEILLTNRHGEVIRAYAMPSEVPSWMLVTDDAVFAGRVGDGGLPNSTLVRIDRRTLEARTLVFPSAEDGGRQVVPDLAGWERAPTSADFYALVHVGNAAGSKGGTGVNSAIGPIAVDLEGIEALFAATAH
jgi:hypothetical protein